LTARQREVLDYLRDCIRTNGRPPTLREAADHFGWRANASLTCHLQALERKGAIQWDRWAARGIRITGESIIAEEGISLLAGVPADTLAEEIENSSESILIDRKLFARPKELYVRRVDGHSMTKAGIFDKDFIIVRKVAEAKPGQIVVARVDGVRSLKRFTMKGEKVFLKVANPPSRSILVQPWQELVIEGVVVGVLRVCE